MYFTLLLGREICKLSDVAYFGKFYRLGEIFLLYLENTSYGAFYGALTCRMLVGVIDPIYFEKSIYMIFGYGDCFASQIWRYLA